MSLFDDEPTTRGRSTSRGSAANGAAPAFLPASRSPRSAAAARIRKCVAPGCNNDNRGPRFGYCCVKHESATAKQKQSWRTDYLEAEKAKAPPPTGLAVLSGAEQAILSFIGSQEAKGATSEELRHQLKVPGPKLTYHINRLKRENRLRSEGSPSHRRHFLA